jgi:Domain of unknown function (DUF4272)
MNIYKYSPFVVAYRALALIAIIDRFDRIEPSPLAIEWIAVYNIDEYFSQEERDFYYGTSSINSEDRLRFGYAIESLPTMLCALGYFIERPKNNEKFTLERIPQLHQITNSVAQFLCDALLIQDLDIEII